MAGTSNYTPPLWSTSHKLKQLICQLADRKSLMGEELYEPPPKKGKTYPQLGQRFTHKFQTVARGRESIPSCVYIGCLQKEPGRARLAVACDIATVSGDHACLEGA